jgi:hypothetical protein
VLQAEPEPAGGAAERALERWLEQPAARGWSGARLRRAGVRYERGLGSQPAAERYWLVLPERGEAISPERGVQ